MMTDRERISELLSAYLDGEVTPEEAGAVEQALREDPGVAMELRELTRTRQLLVRLPQAQAPHDFVRTVMARAELKHLLGARQAGGAFRTTRWITLAVAAVVLVAAGVGFVVINPLKISQPQADELARREVVRRAMPEGPAVAGRAEVDELVDSRAERLDADLDNALAIASNAVIWTDDVSNTVAEVRRSLARNRVLPLEPADRRRGGNLPQPPAHRDQANFFVHNRRDALQAQFVVYAPVETNADLQSEIKHIAGRQRVSQITADAAAVELAKVDDGDVVAPARKSSRAKIARAAAPEAIKLGVAAAKSNAERSEDQTLAMGEKVTHEKEVKAKQPLLRDRAGRARVEDRDRKTIETAPTTTTQPGKGVEVRLGVAWRPAIAPVEEEGKILEAANGAGKPAVPVRPATKPLEMYILAAESRPVGVLKTSVSPTDRLQWVYQSGALTREARRVVLMQQNQGLNNEAMIITVSFRAAPVGKEIKLEPTTKAAD